MFVCGSSQLHQPSLPWSAALTSSQHLNVTEQWTVASPTVTPSHPPPPQGELVQTPGETASLDRLVVARLMRSRGSP